MYITADIPECLTLDDAIRLSNIACVYIFHEEIVTLYEHFELDTFFCRL